jgi:hypothetical protein
MFGKKNEAPSREEFEFREGAIKEVLSENVSIGQTRDNAARMGPLSEGFEQRYTDFREQNHRFLNRMQTELAEMLEACQKEASALNEQHGKLIRKAQEAVEELKAFEVEKLGMKPKDDQEK